PIDSTASAENLASFRAYALDRALEAPDRVLVDERTDERVGIERIADFRGRVCLEKAPGELGRDRPFDDEAPRGRAALTGRPERPEEDRPHGEVEVGVGEHDDGVVSAELEKAPAQSCRHGLRDRTAHAAAPGGAHQRNARIRRQRLADRAVSGDEVEDPREPGWLEHAEDELLDRDRAKGRLLRWLPDDGVAADRRDEGVPR